MINSALFKKYYPDDSKDGTLLFYTWMRSYAQPEFIVLNIGAGPSCDNKIRSLKGEVQKVIGVDIDEEALNNEDLDEAFIIKNDTFPFEDDTFDFAWADYVFEHIEKPNIFLEEIFRVMKPGAPVFFRTPNKNHYVSLVSRLTPHWVHQVIANKARGLSLKSRDPYPTFYRLNSRKEIEKYANLTRFMDIELRFMEAEPSYLMFHPMAFMGGVLYERTVNRFSGLSCIRANILGKLTKIKTRV
jgi:SAM-dependent methyltransferase